MSAIPEKKFRLIALAALAAVALSGGGCATKPKIYKAPDFSKVEAASKKLTEAANKVSATTARLESRVTASQKNADALAASSIDVINLVAELERLVPAELRPQMAKLKTYVDAEQRDAGELVTNLSGAQAEIAQLKEKDIPAVKAAKAESDQAIAAVKSESEETARNATMERNYRIAAEKQLSREKWMRILWRIGGGFLVLGILALIVLFALGKISWSGVKAYLRIK